MWRSERGEADEDDGHAIGGGQRGTVYPLSPCKRDSGVSVFGLARSPPSLSHTLSLSLSLSFSHSLSLTFSLSVPGAASH